MRKALLIAALAAAVAAPPVAMSAPKAQSAEECALAADMALVARALAEEKTERAKAESIVRRIYEVTSSERAQGIVKAIMDAAFAESLTDSAGEFASSVGAACVVHGGDMDSVLGEGI